MPTDTQNNPVASIGDQGSSAFDNLVAGPDGQAPAPVVPKVETPVTPPTTPTPPPAGAQPTQDQGVPAGQQPPAGTTPPPTPQPTHAEIIRATAEAVTNAHNANAQRPQGQQQPVSVANKPVAELSSQEFAERFGVTRANDALIQQIQGADPKLAAAALDTYGQNLVRQAVLMTMEVAEAKIKALEAQVTPATQSWQAYHKEVREKQMKDDFYKQYPDLANEHDLVMEMKDAVLARVNAGQVRFNSPQEAFNAVATATRRILARTQAPGTAPAAGAPAGAAATPPPPPSRTMSAASTAGRAGSGQSAAKTAVDDVFGADAR